MLNIRGQTDYPISGSGADYLIAFPTSVIIGAFCAIILDEKAASRRKRLNTTALGINAISLEGKKHGYSMKTRLRQPIGKLEIQGLRLRI